MSKITIICDRCGYTVTLAVRQAHEARHILSLHNWAARDISSNRGAKKEDYCPECVYEPA